MLRIKQRFQFLKPPTKICTFDLPNDLPNFSIFNTVLYADDTYLCLSDKNLNDLQLAVNSELVKVDRWMRLNHFYQ